MTRRPWPRTPICLLITAAVAVGGCTASSPAAPPEVRGTWITTTANDAIATPAKSAETMARLRDIGLNTVYVETWKNGYTQFPSQTLMDTIGVDRRPALMPADPSDPPECHAAAGRDLLEETLIQAHRNQLIYIAWFEYGFMAAYKDTDNHLRQQKADWMTRTRDGELVSDQNPFVWMNPMRPECQEFLLAIVLEAVEKYDLDGVQLDDRIAWPVTMGYDDYTKRVYAEEQDGALPPDDPRDPDWIAWRAGKVTDFAERFYAALKEARPNLIVSISPAVYPWSLENYSCDWPTWATRGWMTEFVPQNYRYDYAAFENTWHQQVEVMDSPELRSRLIAGVLVNNGDQANPWEDLHREFELVRETLTAGHVHWYSKGVLEFHDSALTDYYDVATNGRSANPHLPADWRPAPVALERDEQGVFTGDVEAGAYRVIAKHGDVWSVLEVRECEAGPVKVLAPDADAVELLVDRRTHVPLEWNE